MTYSRPATVSVVGGVLAGSTHPDVVGTTQRGGEAD